MDLPVPPPPPGEWRYRAKCSPDQQQHFFPDTQEDAEVGKKICMTCPVKRPCSDYALRYRIADGTWGGLTEWDRRSLLRKPKVRKQFTNRTNSVCPECRFAKTIVLRGIRFECSYCGYTWKRQP